MSGQPTVIIMGGGQGKRLYPLTKYRSKPAVPIGGKYRLVDVPISNCINSELRKIFVLTQFNSTSLHRHLHRAFPYEAFNDTSVELLAAEQTLANKDWFQGTADAVRKHFSHYHIKPEDTVLILSGDHLYRMDYRKILAYHEEKKADVTIATIPVPRKVVSQFGIMKIKTNGRIHSFFEKPAVHEKIGSYVIPAKIRKTFGVTNPKQQFLASMGIYVFCAKVLEDILAGKETDFGKEVIPKAIQSSQVYGYVFDGYWRDIGTIGSFFEANLELTKYNSRFSFFDWQSRIFTRSRFLPPSCFRGTVVKNVQVSDGVHCEAEEVEHAILGLRAILRQGSVVRRSVVMGNDYYESETPAGQIPLGIGKHCRIENCILDKNVRIGDNVKILNEKKIQEFDSENYFIREGIVIVPKDAVIKDGTEI